jgi:polygalacturonase
VNGNGKIWWDEAIFGKLPGKDVDTRPRLILIESSADILVEKLTLLNSPFWTLTVEAIRAEMGWINVLVDRKYQAELLAKATAVLDPSTSVARRLRVEFPFPNDIPDWVGRRIRQPQDLNTDGIDPIGTDIWIHDCIVQNADDSIAVKPPPGGNVTSLLHGRFHYNCTRNVTIENMVLTGFGASIGSVGPSMFNPCVDQVVFRNITMPGTGKGIYIKSDAGSCLGGNTSQITNILYVSL